MKKRAIPLSPNFLEFPAFPLQTQEDEWNPHIINHVHDKALDMEGTYYGFLKKKGNDPEGGKGELKLSDLVGDDKSGVLEANFEKGVTLWKSAQTILNETQMLGMFPLAYRLEPILSEPKDRDPIEGSKFGGVPDFRYGSGSSHPNEKKYLEAITRRWPRCGGCGEHMKFLAGVDLSEWLLPLHYMTANSPNHTSSGSKITDRNIHSYQHSGLGFGRDLCAPYWPLMKPFFQIFYCHEPHFDRPVFDSILLIEEKPSECDEELLPMGAYKKAISTFVKKNNIESNIPLQTLEGLALRFDIDIPGEEFIAEWMKDVVEKHPEIFGYKEAPYSFFGRPSSQQTEKRYGCQNTFLGLHRMAPIVNWTDQDRDFSYQIYGCFRCKGQESEQVYCKTDGSCT